MSLLDLSGLSIRYGEDVVVDSVSFFIEAGESVGLVGESGSGKTQIALAALGLLPGNASVSGSIRFQDEELVGASEQALESVDFQTGRRYLNRMMNTTPYNLLGFTTVTLPEDLITIPDGAI